MNRIVARYGLGLLLLAVACGRTPVDVFAGDMAREEIFEPAIDGCSKVDYLFVVDNSSSMADNQHKLATSVADFVAGVDEVLQSVDSVHVGVVTTDAYAHNDEPCQLLGGLITRTGGHNSSAAACGPYAEGGSYMTDADDLEVSMDCATRVGTAGSNTERPLLAVREVVDPRTDSARACTSGFLRPDALLVVVVVTDEDAFEGTGTYDALVDAKRGHDEAIVVLSIAHTEEDTCTARGHAGRATNLLALTRRFEHGVTASICAQTFEGPFACTTDVIRSACGG